MQEQGWVTGIADKIAHRDGEAFKGQLTMSPFCLTFAEIVRRS